MTTNPSVFVSSGARNARMVMIIYLLLLLYSDITHYLRHISRQSSHYHHPGRIFHFIYREAGTLVMLDQEAKTGFI